MFIKSSEQSKLTGHPEVSFLLYCLSDACIRQGKYEFEDAAVPLTATGGQSTLLLCMSSEFSCRLSSLPRQMSGPHGKY